MTPEPDLGMAALKMTIALIMGMVMLVAVLWLLKRLSGRTPAGDRLLRVIAQTPLGLRGQIALVAVPGALLVVAVTRSGVQPLHVISDPAVLAEVMEHPPAGLSFPGAVSFQGILAAFRREPDAGPPDGTIFRKENTGE